VFRYIWIAALALAVSASAELSMEQEDFFGIPDLECLSDNWFLGQSDSCLSGFSYPVDMEVLKLTPMDYRLVILDAYSPHFAAVHAVSATHQNHTSALPFRL
jgi:hypothetical protein